MIEEFKKFNSKEVCFNNKIYNNTDINKEINKLKDFIISNSKSNSPFVYLYAPNHIKTLISFYSIINCNKICVLIDPDIKNYEINELFAQCPPSIVIKTDTSTIDFSYFDEIEFIKSKNEFKPKSDLTGTMIIAFSNAIDGFYKPAMISANNLYSLIKSTDERVDFERVCSLLPFSHLFGFTYGMLSPSFMGRAFLIADTSNLIEIEKIAKQIRDYEITHLLSVPIIYYMLSKVSDIKSYLKNVRSVISGGIKLPKEIFDKFYLNTGKFIQEGYGLTEASPACSLQDIDEINNLTVGSPLSCCELSIRDDMGNSIGRNLIGEVYVRGASVIKGYYNDELFKDMHFDGEWFKTGDIGKIDNKDHLHLISLKKRMLNVAGKNVFPKEVEKIILSHSNVKSVLISGEQNPFLGDIIHATISLKNNNDKFQKELKDWCKENLSSYKLPKRWEFSTSNY